MDYVPPRLDRAAEHYLGRSGWDGMLLTWSGGREAAEP
jgi:hypothetical protein